MPVAAGAFGNCGDEDEQEHPFTKFQTPDERCVEHIAQDDIGHHDHADCGQNNPGSDFVKGLRNERQNPCDTVDGLVHFRIPSDQVRRQAYR